MQCYLLLLLVFICIGSIRYGFVLIAAAVAVAAAGSCDC